MFTTSTFTQTFTTAGTWRIQFRYCDNDGQWGSYYIFTIEIIDCKRYYYVKDHLGNIRQTVDENGVIISAQDYSPYGEIVRSYNNADANDKYKFTEKERDKETNLDYFGARYYDASIGRWLAVDPLADKYPGWSPYNYVLNNPLNMFDPDGQDPFKFSNRDAEMEVTMNFIKGVSNAIGNTVEGVWNAVTHPVETAENLWNAVTHPVETVENIVDAVENKVEEFNNGDMNKKSEVLGEAVGTIGEIVLGTKGAGKIGKIGNTVTKTVNKIKNNVKKTVNTIKNTRVKFSIHNAHHSFKLLGNKKLPHIQITTWQKGKKGSGKNIRIPLPKLKE